MPVSVAGIRHVVEPGSTLEVPLDGHGPQISGLLPKRPPTGGTRTDGSRITAGVPTAIPLPEAGDPPPA